MVATKKKRKEADMSVSEEQESASRAGSANSSSAESLLSAAESEAEDVDEEAESDELLGHRSSSTDGEKEKAHVGPRATPGTYTANTNGYFTLTNNHNYPDVKARCVQGGL